jgi:hypothetical protein
MVEMKDGPAMRWDVDGAGKELRWRCGEPMAAHAVLDLPSGRAEGPACESGCTRCLLPRVRTAASDKHLSHGIDLYAIRNDTVGQRRWQGAISMTRVTLGQNVECQDAGHMHTAVVGHKLLSVMAGHR